MQRSLPCPEEDLTGFTDVETQDLVEDLAELQIPQEDAITPVPGETAEAEEALESTGEDPGEARWTRMPRPRRTSMVSRHPVKLEKHN